MKNFAVRVLINAFALSAAAWLVDGIQLSDDYAAVLVVALIFGVLNAVLKPILMFLSLPFVIVTLGLFALVVNGAMLLLTARLSDSLAVSGLAQWGSNFGITMTFPIMLAGIGLAGAYGFYTVCAVISIFFVARMVHETRGVELEDMAG